MARLRRGLAGIAIGAAALGARVGAAPGAGWVEEYPAIATQTRAACKDERLEECRAGLERLLVLLDNRADLACRLARTDLKAGDTAAAMPPLEVCARSGLEMPDPASEPSLAAIAATPALGDIERAYRDGQRPAAGFSPRASLGDAGLIAEDVAFDPADGSFLVSSVRQRKIVRVRADGTVTDAWRPDRSDVWGLFALALDPQRHHLWVTTSAGPESPPFSGADRGRSAVLELDSRSFALLARFELSDRAAHGFGDVTLGAGGECIVSDGTGGGVYATEERPRPHLRTLVAPGSIASPQTPAVLNGGGVLVPDYVRGIARLDARGGATEWLRHPKALALHGIDGLYAHGRTVIAVQNGTNPERLVVMRLDPSCRSVESWRVAVARVPGLGDPTHGTFAGDSFVFIANSGWDRLSEEGVLAPAGADGAPALWNLALEPGESEPAACAAATG